MIALHAKCKRLEQLEGARWDADIGFCCLGAGLDEALDVKGLVTEMHLVRVGRVDAWRAPSWLARRVVAEVPSGLASRRKRSQAPGLTASAPLGR
jgi:hypothetical protein